MTLFFFSSTSSHSLQPPTSFLYRDYLSFLAKSSVRAWMASEGTVIKGTSTQAGSDGYPEACRTSHGLISI